MNLFMFIFLFLNHPISIHWPKKNPLSPAPSLATCFIGMERKFSTNLTPTCLIWGHLSGLNRKPGMAGKNTRLTVRRPGPRFGLCWVILTESVNSNTWSLFRHSI